MKLVMLGAIALVLARMAHAQDYCGDLKEVIAEATFGIDGLKDEENFEDSFEPYFYMSNAYPGLRRGRVQDARFQMLQRP